MSASGGEDASESEKKNGGVSKFRHIELFWQKIVELKNYGTDCKNDNCFELKAITD